MTKINDWPVMQHQCSTCPFNVDKYGRHADPVLVGRIETHCLTKASQICHHPVLSGKRQTHLCRGARDFQLMIFYRLGLLSEPTDRAWDHMKDKCAQELGRKGGKAGTGEAKRRILKKKSTYGRKQKTA